MSGPRSSSATGPAHGQHTSCSLLICASRRSLCASTLLSTAGPGAAAQRGAKAGAAAAERFQTKQAITEALFVSEALQHLQRRPPVGEQAIEMLLVREINLTGIDNLRPVVRKQPRRAACYAVAAC